MGDRKAVREWRKRKLKMGRGEESEIGIVKRFIPSHHPFMKAKRSSIAF